MKDKLFDIINYIILGVLTIVIIYPLYFIIIASISDPNSVASGDVFFLPVGFTLDAYKYTFEYDLLWSGYKNTIIYTVGGTLYNLVLTIPAAYVLSKKDIPFKNIMSTFFFITMYLSGGLIPTFLLMSKLGLINTPWVMILGAGVQCYNLIVSRQFFTNNIPDEVFEAAEIDGATQWKCFTAIAIPLSGSIIAIMALFYGVGHWNSYTGALIYLHEKELYPLQLVLRMVLLQNQNLLENMDTMTDSEILSAMERANLAEGMKYALIFIASFPLLVAYPFVQKFFVKGVMVGSVKG